MPNQPAQPNESARPAHQGASVIPLQKVTDELRARAASSAQKNPTTDAETEVSLYEVRQKIYPRAVHGWFAQLRWGMVLLTQLLYYGLAWLPWNDRQAILFDLAQRKFYIFGLVLWPQDFFYLTILLILSALGLFLFTAMAGRLFCGYACPQTVYTEIFMWIERKVEGERAARQKLDEGGWTIRKLGLKSTKFALWGLLAFWTGFTFVGYFTPIQTLFGEVFLPGHDKLGSWEFFWLFFYAGFTFLQAGFMREQVCKYMCPYARFQSAMFDKDTLVITYDQARGEPRGARNKKADPTQLGLGSCVDCGICVQVCPTGIDIRKGLQYECIGCAACIDACDQVMDKMNYSRGLIRYATENGLKNHWDRAQMLRRIFRPRVLVYGGILLSILLISLASLAFRTPFKVDVIRDRGSLGREIAEGYIENVYRLQLMNTDERGHTFTLSAHGLDGIKIVSDTAIPLAATETRMVVVKVQVPPNLGKPGPNPIYFDISRADFPDTRVAEKAVFHIPRR